MKNNIRIILVLIITLSAVTVVFFVHNKAQVQNKIADEVSVIQNRTLHTYEMLDLKNGYLATTTGVYYQGRDVRGNFELKRIDFDDVTKVLSGEITFKYPVPGFNQLGDIFFLREFRFDPKEFGLTSSDVPAFDINQNDAIYFSFGDKHFKMLTAESGKIQLLEPNDQVHIVDKNLDKHIALNTQYVVIGGKVYINDNKSLKLLPLADAKTFEIVGMCASVERSGGYYTKDSQRVFVDEKVISENAKSFVLFESYADTGEISASNSFSKDADHVFYGCGEIVEGADPKTFVYVGNGVARDSNYEYKGSFGYGKYTKVPIR